jgi:hypothetical protein
VVFLALAALQMCHAGGVFGTGSVTNVSRRWCWWQWQRYKCVTRVVLLALAALQMCHAGGVFGTGSVTNVSRGWCFWHWQRYKLVTRVVVSIMFYDMFYFTSSLLRILFYFSM